MHAINIKAERLENSTSGSNSCIFYTAWGALVTEYYPRLFWLPVEASLKKVKWNEMPQKKTKQNKTKREKQNGAFLGQQLSQLSVLCLACKLQYCSSFLLSWEFLLF